MQIELINIDDIIPYENNAKLHPKEQIEQIKKSILEFGNNDPIAIDKNNVIVEGHGRLLALKELGYKEVEVIKLGHLTDEQRKAYTLIHNKLTMNTDFDIEVLESELAAINIIDMSDFDFELELESNEIVEDEYEVKLPKEPKAKLGDIYQLGNHRLMCGDSTSINDVKKLMNNKVGKCLFTSPPYNMNGGMYENYTDNLESKKYIDFNMNVVNTWLENLRGYLFWNISYNKNSRWEFIEILYRIVKETGMRFLELIVWDKGHGIPIRSKEMLTRQYEDILLVGNEENIYEDMELYYLGSTEKRGYFNKKKGKGITNYWRITTGDTQLDNHKACFPIELPAKAIELTTEQNDIVLEPFGGSGSTLIACEQLNRYCYMMELDPKYVDVIIDRWEQLTGNKAVLL